MQNKIVISILICFLLLPPFVHFSIASDESEAQKLLSEGLKYQYGKEQNIEKAIEVLTKASEMEFLPAQYMLAKIYEEGDGSEDINKSIELYVSAAEKGYIHAQQHLGQLYRIGEKVKQDYKKSIYYYSLANKNGDKWAPFFLGLMHEYGNGVSISYDKAILYYEQAANRDNSKAQNALGRVYEHKSKDSKNNLLIALKWYMIGAERHKIFSAINNSKRLSATLTKEQITQAKQLAEAWEPSIKLLENKD